MIELIILTKRGKLPRIEIKGISNFFALAEVVEYSLRIEIAELADLTYNSGFIWGVWCNSQLSYLASQNPFPLRIDN